VIKKAIENGWHAFGGANNGLKAIKGVRYSQRAVGDGPFAWPVSFRDHTRFDYSLEQIIFNHDFAKALWGEIKIKEKLTNKVRYEYRDKHYRYYDEQGDLNFETVPLSKLHRTGLSAEEIERVKSGEVVNPVGDETRGWERVKQTVFVSHGWQQNLQQMVIADDPIKYLEDNI
jgi:hypothetical protein